jgi:hypothetical protein
VSFLENHAMASVPQDRRATELMANSALQKPLME